MDTNSYYKKWIDNLQSREKEKCVLQNEAIRLREKGTSLLIQLQDLVNPKKWITLAQLKELILKELELLKNMDVEINLNDESCEYQLNIDETEFQSVMNQADEFLKEYEVSDDTVERIV